MKKIFKIAKWSANALLFTNSMVDSCDFCLPDGNKFHGEYRIVCTIPRTGLPGIIDHDQIVCQSLGWIIHDRTRLPLPLHPTFNHGTDEPGIK